MIDGNEANAFIRTLTDRSFQFIDAAAEQRPETACAMILAIAANFAGSLLSAVAARVEDPEAFLIGALPEMQRQIRERAEMELPENRQDFLAAVAELGGALQ